MKCINPIVANFITQIDLSGRKRVLKRSFFSFRKFFESVRISLSRMSPGDFISSFKYSSQVVYENYTHCVRQSYVATSSKGLQYSTPSYSSSTLFSHEIAVADDEDDVAYDSKSFLVRCRKCASCILSSVREKTFRCMKEFQTADKVGCMLTLTYKDEYLPYKTPESTQPVVRYRDVQLFLKRLRKNLFGNKGGYLKYFACCEYAPKNNRPHIHIFLIGYDFGLAALKTNPRIAHEISCAGVSEHSRCPYYMSKRLNALWPFGRATISVASSQTASYVAGYTMKKFLRGATVVDGVPECHHFSKGLGEKWFLLHYAEILRQGRVIVDYIFETSPFPIAIPSYFLRLAKVRFPFLYEDFIKKKDYFEEISFSLEEFYLLDALRKNLEKKFAFISR